MRKSEGWTAAIAATLIPMVPMMYLFNQNAAYLSGEQVFLVGGLMMGFSLVAYFVFRWLLRSRLAGFLGCLTSWVVFFGFSALYAVLVEDKRLISASMYIRVYAAAGVLLLLVVLLLARKREGQAFCTFMLVFTSVLLAMNLFPAVQTMLTVREHDRTVDLTKVKTEFSVDQATSTPNVYWFHLDGMLGLDAYSTWFGDDQAEFRAALEERGLALNEKASLEANHATSVAVPALMCPYFYDNFMQETLTAGKDINDALNRSELLAARLHNEMVRAFEARGYAATVIAPYSEYFTVLVNRYYDIYDFSNGGIIPFTGSEEQILAQHRERSTLFNMYQLLLKRWALTAFRRTLYIGGVGSKALESPYAGLEDALGSYYASKPQAVNFFNALNDALDHPLDKPSMNVLHYMLPHYPFVNEADGKPVSGDINDIRNYKGHQQYAAKALIHSLDMILSRDPDAVIVLQADHGLHGQSEAQITAAFGKDAVLPIWNQVMSALRVPEKYKSGEESFALSNPLNMSRYLVNSYVGKNYAYVD